MSEAAQRVVVIQDASRDISSSAIKWAIDGLSLIPGDELTLLGVLHHFTNPSTFHFMGAGKMMGYKSRVDSSSILAVNQKTIDQEVGRKEEAFRNSIELLQIGKLFEMRKIAFHRRVVAASSPKVAALEAAKNLKATWIILDRQMKKDKKYFLDGLSCGISRIKRNNNVELLRGPKTTQRIVEHTGESQSSNVNEMLQGLQIKPGVLEEIHGISDDEDLFSLEILPMKSKSPENSPKDQLANDSRKGPPEVTIMTSSSPTYPIGENPKFLNTVSTPVQKDPECLSSFRCDEARCFPPQLKKDECLSSQGSAADDDSSLATSDHHQIQRFVSNETSDQETEQKHTNTTEKILTYGGTNRQLEDRLECPECLDCGNELLKIEVTREFTYAELHTATNGFSTENFLSQGGFGSVYKGKLRDGQRIAVKQYKHASLQGEEEFRSEVHVLSKARHKNVLMLLGSCSEGSHRLLVYEYICNRSLDIHLSKHSPKVLSWERRMNIALGLARGLNYLHQNNIIHRDTRPSNILVTHYYDPLLGDFGLARKQNDESEHLPETKVAGTLGYLAPEYAERGRVSTKTDVYSFGVVLLELISGRTTGNKTLQEKGLVEWARPLLKEKKYPELIDDRILDCHDVHQLFWMVRVSELCLRKDPDKRPSMEQVEHALKCTIDGETVTVIDDFSPTSSSDGSLPYSNESQDEQEMSTQEITSTSSSSFSRSSVNEAFSRESSMQSLSRSMSVSTNAKSSSSGGRKRVWKKRGKSRSQVFYDEMLS